MGEKVSTRMSRSRSVSHWLAKLAAAAAVALTLPILPAAISEAAVAGPVNPAVDGSQTVSCTLAATNSCSGLTQDDFSGDGVTQPVTEDGQSARQTVQVVPGVLNMYFNVDNSIAYDGNYEATFTVQYYDQGTSTWTLQYDSTNPNGGPVNGAYTTGGSVTEQNSGTWTTATFSVSDAQFADRENGGNDFRIASASPVTIHSVSVQITAQPELPQQVSVDVASDLGRPSGAGRGFLYGLSADGTQPADAYLRPLAPTSFRSGGEIDQPGTFGWAFGDDQFLPRYAAVAAQAERVTRAPYNATFDILVSDLWGSDGSGLRPTNIPEPCDDGPGCASWVSFLTELVGKLRADGLLNPRVRFDIWNEPAANSYFWPRTMDQYYEMWNAAVTTIRSLDPRAVIVGPSIANYDHASLLDLLTHFKAAGTVPNILNWHFGDDPVADAADARAIVASLGLPPMPMTINEYLFASQQDPGDSAWWLARLQRSGVQSASHAIWANCCEDPVLDGLLDGSGSSATTTGSYWTFAAAAATGTLLSSNGSAKVDLLATRDTGAQRVSALLGSNGFTGDVQATFTGFGKEPSLANQGAVRVVVTELTNGDQPAPAAIEDAVQPVVNGSVDVSIPWASPTSAYEVTITPETADATTVDAGTRGTGLGEFDYGPGWHVTSGLPGLFDGTANRASGPGHVATFAFDGTQAQLYAEAGPDQGSFTVSVDDGTPTTVDDSAQRNEGSELVWTSPALSAGTHVLTIRTLGGTGNGGSLVALDRVDIPQTFTPVDASASSPSANAFTYGQGWSEKTGVRGAFFGTLQTAAHPGDKATFSFTGTQAALFAATGPRDGSIDISLDGGPATVVSTRSRTASPSTVMWTSPVLPRQAHTVTITVDGAHGATGPVMLDRADVLDPGGNLIADDSTTGTGLDQWEYSAGWGTANGVSDLYDGTTHYSPVAGAQATLSFQGSQVILHTVHDVDQGIMQVSVDGGPATTIDDYSPTRDAQAVSYTSPVLAYGMHTLTLTVSGTNNPASAGNTIAIDYAEIVRTVVAPAVPPNVSDVAVTVPSGSGAVPIAPDFTGGGAPATVHVAQAPSHGTAIAAGLSLTYKPDPGYHGTDTFTYTASNANGISQPATVTITVQ
jgi:hypothetical protein